MKTAEKMPLIKLIEKKFRTFGGEDYGNHSEWNPISAAMKGKPLQFAAGVDVQQVIDFVLEHHQPESSPSSEHSGVEDENSETSIEARGYADKLSYEPIKDCATPFDQWVIRVESFIAGASWDAGKKENERLKKLIREMYDKGTYDALEWRQFKTTHNL